MKGKQESSPPPLMGGFSLCLSLVPLHYKAQAVGRSGEMFTVALERFLDGKRVFQIWHFVEAELVSQVKQERQV